MGQFRTGGRVRRCPVAGGGHRMDGVSWGGVPWGLGCFGGEAAVGRGQSERLQLRVLAAF